VIDSYGLGRHCSDTTVFGSGIVFRTEETVRLGANGASRVFASKCRVELVYDDACTHTGDASGSGSDFVRHVHDGSCQGGGASEVVVNVTGATPAVSADNATRLARQVQALVSSLGGTWLETRHKFEAVEIPTSCNIKVLKGSVQGSSIICVNLLGPEDYMSDKRWGRGLAVVSSDRGIAIAYTAVKATANTYRMTIPILETGLSASVYWDGNMLGRVKFKKKVAGAASARRYIHYKANTRKY
jgi:hypothetical protein